MQGCIARCPSEIRCSDCRDSLRAAFRKCTNLFGHKAILPQFYEWKIYLCGCCGGGHIGKWGNLQEGYIRSCRMPYTRIPNAIHTYSERYAHVCRTSYACVSSVVRMHSVCFVGRMSWHRDEEPCRPMVGKTVSASLPTWLPGSTRRGYAPHPLLRRCAAERRKYRLGVIFLPSPNHFTQNILTFVPNIIILLTFNYTKQ